MRLHVLLLFAALAPCLGAQPAIGRAVLGYAYDPGSSAIRSIEGIPGAAILGRSYQPDFAWAGAVVAPLQSYALAADSAGNVHMIRGLTTTPSADSLDVAPADRFFFSPSGVAAVLYDSLAGGTQVVTGLPDQPSARTVFLARSPGAAIAVRDDGTVAAASAEGVRILAPDSNSFLLPISNAVALSFERSGNRLVAITGSGDVYLADFDNGLNLSRVAAAAIADEIVATAFVPDGAGMIIATAGGSVAVVDFSDGTVRSRDCQCAPTGLYPIGRPGLFRLTDISDRPLTLFDALAKEPRFWFVPADPMRRAQ